MSSRLLSASWVLLPSPPPSSRRVWRWVSWAWSPERGRGRAWLLRVPPAAVTDLGPRGGVAMRREWTLSRQAARLVSRWSPCVCCDRVCVRGSPCGPTRRLSAVPTVQDTCQELFWCVLVFVGLVWIRLDSSGRAIASERGLSGYRRPFPLRTRQALHSAQRGSEAVWQRAARGDLWHLSRG